MRKSMSAVLVALLVAGCATSYQPQGFSGGFSELQLDPITYRVTFKGNGYTDPERAEDFTLLRCAELALEQGASHFIIQSERSRIDSSTFTTPGMATTTGTLSPSGYGARLNATTTYSGGNTFHVAKPSSTNVITLIYGEPPDWVRSSFKPYSAAFLVESISKKYKMSIKPKK